MRVCSRIMDVLTAQPEAARPAVIPLRLTVREARAPAGSFLTLTANPNTLYTCFCVEEFL